MSKHFYGDRGFIIVSTVQSMIHDMSCKYKTPLMRLNEAIHHLKAANEQIKIVKKCIEPVPHMDEMLVKVMDEAMRDADHAIHLMTVAMERDELQE